ncbi:hypothetical protein GCM10010349_65710 [Streptomyces flavofungini]|nr:hypothetical protein GCM10010349_65710 [Streptomyces flavofungini]
MLQLVPLGGGEPVVAFAVVGLGLADPAAQGLLMDAQVLRDVRDRTAGGADLTDRALPEFVRVLRGAGVVLVDLLRQDRNPDIRNSTKISAAQFGEPAVSHPGVTKVWADSGTSTASSSTESPEDSTSRS